VDALRPSSLILRTDAAGPLSSWSHQLRLNEAGHFEHYLFDGAGHVVVATNTVLPGVWYHVAITAASHGNMQIYVNGVAGGGTEPVGWLWSGGDQWRLGSNAGNAARFYAGRMDEIGIWHTVLSSETIRRLAGGRSPAQPGGYSALFETDVLGALYQKNSSLWLRIPFQNPSAAGYDQLLLQARCADGFVAFLNGTEVVRRNAPQPLSWNSTATVDRLDADGLNLESFDLSPFLPSLVAGKNVLAVQALGSSATNSAFLFAAELSARPATANPVTNVVFSEIAGSGSAPFFLEMLNFPGREGDRLFLLGPDGGLIDAVEIQRRARARLTATVDAPWCYPSRETPAQANEFFFHREIVINEIMYHHAPVYRTRSTPFAENRAQWIELYNTSSHVVDLGAWQLAGAVSFTFPAGLTLAPDSYLVIANDPPALRARYPEIVVLGPFAGRLSHHDAHVILRDANGNSANEVHYWNTHPWPAYANGGGSSLELRDPRADNSVAEAWGASLEGTQAPWRHYSYRAVAIQPVYSPEIFSFHEFRMGLLDEGEALIDNITVTEMTSPPRQLLQNTDFSSGTARWRLLGNHSHSVVEPSPDDPVNRVLHLVATGNTRYLDNRLETTLKSGTSLAPVVAGREYEIAFDAKWLAGSPQLRTELYYKGCGHDPSRNAGHCRHSRTAQFHLHAQRRADLRRAGPLPGDPQGNGPNHRDHPGGGPGRVGVARALVFRQRRELDSRAHDGWRR
jgi:hypothetical protein